MEICIIACFISVNQALEAIRFQVGLKSWLDDYLSFIWFQFFILYLMTFVSPVCSE